MSCVVVARCVDIHATPTNDNRQKKKLKAYLMMFAELYAAVMTHCQVPGTLGAARASFLANVHMDSGRLATPWVSSLGAFWPGMQALLGARLVVVDYVCAVGALQWLVLSSAKQESTPSLTHTHAHTHTRTHT